MSVISYNGVTLPIAYLSRFSQQAVADDSDTDMYLTKFEIQVECVINFNYLSMMWPTIVGKTENPAVIIKTLRQKLLERRKDLSITFNGVDLLPDRQSSDTGTVMGTVDAKNGPIPQKCDFTDLGEETFLCQYAITAHYWENTGVNDGTKLAEKNKLGNPVLSHRWTETIDYDNLMMATRTRDGTMIIRSDMLENKIADQLRTNLSIMGVPDGFVRDKMKYGVDKSGLVLTYSLTDKEVFKMPPAPAYWADGDFTETTPKGGAQRHMTVNVRLKGSKTTDQGVLMNVAIKVATQKVRLRAVQLEQAKIIKSRSLPVEGTAKMGLYDNSVEFTLKASYPANNLKLWGLNGFQSMDTVTPGSQSQTPPTYFVRGTSNILLQAAAYYDPNVTAQQGQRTDPVGAANEQFVLGGIARAKAIGRAGQGE